MEERIIEILRKEKRALSVHELELALELSSVEDLKNLLKELNKLENEVRL